MGPRHPDDELDFTALARLFAGEMPADEAAALRRWIDGDPDRRELVERLEEVWDHAASLGQSWDAERALRDIRMKARRQPAPDVLPLRRPAPRRTSKPASPAFAPPARRPRWWFQPAAAAAAVLLAGTSALWWLTTRPRADGEAMAEVVTGVAERGELRLPDGSRVVLGVDSRLRYPDGFGRRSRDVLLSGAAYFEVTRNARRPFRVHTDRGTAEVLGTRFGVRAYPGATATEVAMIEGQVALGPRTARDADSAPVAREAEPVVLRAGDVGVIDAAGAVHVEHDADVDSRLAWTDGRLVFQDTPLREAVAELARWYDLEVQITDSTLAAQPVTASFHREPVAQILIVIASAVDADYERDGRVVTLSPNGGVR